MSHETATWNPLNSVCKADSTVLGTLESSETWQLLFLMIYSAQIVLHNALGGEHNAMKGNASHKKDSAMQLAQEKSHVGIGYDRETVLNHVSNKSFLQTMKQNDSSVRDFLLGGLSPEHVLCKCTRLCVCTCVCLYSIWLVAVLLHNKITVLNTF